MKSPKVAFVASTKISKKYWGSTLIRLSTKHLHPELTTPSHLAIILKKTLVIESTLTTGVRIIPYNAWIKDNKVLHSFSSPYEGGLSNYIPELLDKTWGKSYDWPGVLYFFYSLLINKLFKIPIPNTNKWDNPDKRFCVEIFGDKLSMVSPVQMVPLWEKDPTLTRIEWQE